MELAVGIGRDAVVGFRLLGFLGGFLFRGSALASHALGVGENLSGAIPGFDDFSGFIDGFSLSIGGLRLAGSMGFSLLANLPGLETRLGCG